MISALLGQQCQDSSPGQIHSAWPVCEHRHPFSPLPPPSPSPSQQSTQPIPFPQPIDHLLASLPHGPESILSVSSASMTSSSNLDCSIRLLCAAPAFHPDDHMRVWVPNCSMKFGTVNQWAQLSTTNPSFLSLFYLLVRFSFPVS